MTKQTIMKLNSEIKKDLADGNLSSAFSRLSDYASRTADYRLADQLSTLRQSYGYLLQYMMEGKEDPQRESMLADIREELLSITDKIRRETVAIDSPDIFSETFRILRLRPDSFSDHIARFRKSHAELLLAESVGNRDENISKSVEASMRDIFNHIWVMPGNSSLRSAIMEVVTSDSVGDTLPLLMISALTLSLTGDFDRYKFETLLDIMERELSEELTARSMIGIVLALARHKSRISSIPSLIRRMDSFRDSLMHYRRFREIVFGMIRTRDTDRVATKMKEEVIPEIMKLRPEILSKMREAGGDMESMGFEDNPEWQEIFKKSGLADKMKELSEMQEDGSDLMMVAFSNLKQFTFFNDVSNWFLPFNVHHSSLSLNENEEKMLEDMLGLVRTICDSDRYSLALALSRMPADRRAIVPAQLSQQLSQHSEDLKEAALKSASPAFDEEVTRVVRDLYRFFKLFRKKDSFRDPFGEVLQFTDLPVVGDLMSDTEIVMLAAEFYMKRKYYPEALNLITLLLEDDSDNASLYEKAGFCYQCMKFYDKALEAYSKAELLAVPGKWLIRKLAIVNRQCGNFREAYGYYLKALDKDPENRTLLLNAGYCALHADMVAEALKHYYHAEYLKTGDIKVMRAIAWAELLRKEYDKSLKYYNRILETEPSASDFLNLGHLNLVRGNYKEAVKAYSKALSESPEGFERSFFADIVTLEKLGISRNSALLVLDWMRENVNQAF